jgi:hypothetical protein
MLPAKPGPQLLDLMLHVHEQFVHDVTSLATTDIPGLPPAEIRGAIRGAAEAACQKVCRRGAISPSPNEHEWLVEAVIDEAFGLGPLERLLQNPAITAIRIRGPQDILAERPGGVDPTTVAFRDQDHLQRVLQRIPRRNCVTRTSYPDEPAIRVDVQRLREKAVAAAR